MSSFRTWDPEYHILVKDPVSLINYKPNLDNEDYCDCGCKALDPEKLKEESRWEQLAKLRDADVKQNADADRVSKEVEAMDLYRSIEKSNEKLLQACQLLDIPVRVGTDSLDSWRDKIYAKITSNKRNTYGRTYLDIFIGGMSRIKDKPKQEITIGIPEKWTIRWAHMIGSSDEAIKSIQVAQGKYWLTAAYKALFERGENDFEFNNKYSATLFDDHTILIYDKAYKIEQSWDEEDLVVSQLNWR